MVFDTLESSVESSRPIELYTITLGAEQFFWTSSEDDITIGATVYEAIPLQRGRIIQSPENRENIVDVTVGGTNLFAKKYIDVVPGNRAKMTIQRLQRADLGAPDIITLYVGYVQSVQFSRDGYTAVIATLPIAAATSRSIPRYTYQGLCNNVLYDDACGVDDTDSTWRLSNAEVLSTSGADITVQGADGEADGYWTGGYVEALGGQDSRLILAHTGTTLTLLQPFPADQTGAVVNLFAGCDHTISTCDSKFFTTEDLTSNVINYGGFHFVPTRDIFQLGID